MKQQAPDIYVFAAYSGTGKTTYLTRLIPCLKAKGLRVAAVKHDVHGLSLDVPGTDSRRLAEAGELMSYQHQGFWQCMDTLFEKTELEQLWKSGRAPWKVW